jgi:MbtH protein
MAHRPSVDAARNYPHLLAAGHALTLAGCKGRRTFPVARPDVPSLIRVASPRLSWFVRNVEGAVARRACEAHLGRSTGPAGAGRRGLPVRGAAPLALRIGMRITMANPFEDPDASYRVLVNHEGQHSLWPATQPTPDGWTVAHDTDSRAACLEYIETNWTDMRPRSLIEAEGEGLWSIPRSARSTDSWISNCPAASCERKKGHHLHRFIWSG